MTEQKAEYKTVTTRRKTTRDISPDKTRTLFTRDQNPAAFALWDRQGRPFGETFSVFARKLLEENSQKILESLNAVQEEAPLNIAVQDNPPQNKGEQSSTSGGDLFEGILT